MKEAEEPEEVPSSHSVEGSEHGVSAVSGIPPIPTTGSFHFMQESELEASTFEEGAEWVERPFTDSTPAAEHASHSNGHTLDSSTPADDEVGGF